MASRLWAIAHRQHGVVSRRQLLELGFTPIAIEHRLARGRLHPVMRGVYAVGRPDLGRLGHWMAAVLRCGPYAALSHECAAAAWKILSERPGPITVSVFSGACPNPPGIRVYRRADLLAGRLSTVAGIPVTDPVLTLVDLAAHLSPNQVEGAINEADKRDLISPVALRAEIEQLAGQPGVLRVRNCLDQPTFTLTESELERRFLRIAHAAGLPRPLTGQRLNGFKVDFLWPDLGLVVETDGLRYHRTPVQQARDRRRDQAHARAGLMALRFTHAQVRFQADDVRRTLAAVAERLADDGRRATRG